ncbi:hypothetical protein MMC10_000853 [Thelotrema lepadinum]|nr:hypothetical protein [Thelotrema lepadinum]
MGFSKLLQMILKAQRHKPSKQTDYMIELATFIAPPLLLREIEYKIQHESETDLDTALASTLSQVDAVFQLLDHGRERVGLKLPLDRERLFAQYLVTGMEDSHSNLSRPGRQFSLLNPEPYQNFQSSRWEVYKFKVAGKNRRYAGSKTGTIQQTFRRALIYYMSPYQQRWLRTVVGTQKVSTELEWIAFSLFNLLTAVVYYLYVFDGAATVNPSWTGIFG